MARIITKELATSIARVLGAEVRSTGKGHDIALIRHEGRVVATFGIRRGSGRDAGHDHVPLQIFLSPHNARRLAQCPMSREECLAEMARSGRL